jgi:hypothetical protein
MGIALLVIISVFLPIGSSLAQLDVLGPTNSGPAPPSEVGVVTVTSIEFQINYSAPSDPWLGPAHQNACLMISCPIQVPTTLQGGFGQLIVYLNSNWTDSYSRTYAVTGISSPFVTSTSNEIATSGLNEPVLYLAYIPPPGGSYHLTIDLSA